MAYEKLHIPLDQKLLWNVSEVAAALGVHQNTVWNRVRADKLPAPIKWDGRTVWKRAEIEGFVERLAG